VDLPSFDLCWVAYSPTQYDPSVGRDPLKSSLRDDLRVLYDSGFRGVITYGATGILDRIPQLAKEIGFEQVVMGVWNPLDADELARAIAAAQFVDGYIIGNEGLGDGRYAFDDLRQAMEQVRAATNRPVATTERPEEYYGVDGLLDLGDWLAPTVHPYWHAVKEPAQAAAWTAQQFADLRAEVRPDRVVQFKEVGLPTEGDPEVSETAQAAYYQALRKSEVVFAYFEAFDQSWKSGTPESAVGPHWGLFRSDRSPKLAAGYVCGRMPPTPTASVTPTPSPTGTVTQGPTQTPTPTPLPPRVISIYHGTLAPGYELNIDNESHTFGWLGNEAGALRADFPADQKWAVIYITLGPPRPVGQREQFEDISSCRTLAVDLRALHGGTQVELGMKDVEDPDNGSETLIPVTLATDWKTHRVTLSELVTADLHRIYLPFEIVYRGSGPATVFINNIRLICKP
jgi:exo-beta-1,3-glucanase (GH17 family)